MFLLLLPMTRLQTSFVSLCLGLYSGFCLPATALAEPPAKSTNAPAGYVWPYDNKTTKELSASAPVFAEMFYDEDMMMSIPSALFMNDLSDKTNFIVLSCHLPSKFLAVVDNLATKDCFDRQVFYMIVHHIVRDRPQMYLNGHTVVKPYMYKKVLAAVDQARGDGAPVYLPITETGHNKGVYNYTVSIPASPMGRLEKFDDRAHVRLLEYLVPQTTLTFSGPFEDQLLTHKRVVSRVIELDPWFGDNTPYSFKWTPSFNAAGAVLVVERQDKGLMAFGEIKLAPK